MKKSSFRANSRLFLLVLFFLCSVSGSLLAQKSAPLPKATAKQSNAKAPAKPHKKVKKKKGVAIVHHSDDDKKLTEVKAAKAKPKSGK